MGRGVSAMASNCRPGRVPCVRVEYDLGFWGGDYSGVGQFAYVPFEAVGARGSVEEAFFYQTGHDPAHVIHYAPDEVYDQHGEEWEDFL
jgi:hypothetical protein